MADKRRRKSLSIFRQKHEAVPQLTTSFNPSPLTPENAVPHSAIDVVDPSSPRSRPRTLQKQSRVSTFGSLRSLQSLDADEKELLKRSDSKNSSTHEDQDMPKRGLFGNSVLHHSEVQAAATNVFRKKSHYAVLTDTHLIRFRTQARAAEMFAGISTAMTRTTSRMSVGSYTDVPVAAYHDIAACIPLHQVVAVYKLDDGRPFFTIEVAALDEQGKKSATIQLHISEPNEAEQWISSIRNGATAARARQKADLSPTIIDYVARAVERDGDYDPEHFHVYRAAQRAGPNKSVGRTSAEDLTKLTSTVCYLAVGLHKIHLVPHIRANDRASSTSLVDFESPQSFGLALLTSVKVHSEQDDAFQLTFKSPLRPPYTASLASSDAYAIAICIRTATEWIRPEWLRQPFLFDVPYALDDYMRGAHSAAEDYKCFDRTLMAYCAAYDADTSRICYTVDHNCEDAPRFQLLPATGNGKYTTLELLAVFRALRYNESFVSISFADVNLCTLRYLYDVYATDIDSVCNRAGQGLNLLGHYDLPVLSQEVRALALKNRKLRRLDFSSAFPALSEGEEEADSCCIPEALFPLCKKGWTNVDWVVFNGVRLADSDVNFLVDAASERICHLRALEVGGCDLSVHDADVLLSTLAVQANTLEVINISGVQGKFSALMFQRHISAFRYIRRLNLSRVHKNAGPEPLIPPETLMTWRLEALHISQTTLDVQTVDAIAAYLASHRSEILRELYLDQCGLTGRDLAVFFRSMVRVPGVAREMHISANENRLKQGMSNLFKAIADNCGPSSLTMRMMDFEKEHYFRELIEALTHNTTLRSLDMAKASLPYDAGTETCEALKDMLAKNETLETLDISGEHAHLDATRFGIGLNIALRGLSHNHTLKILRIEHQSLGLQGASTLAEVIETNDSLLEIHCEHNDLNLQSFTVLVNALEKNRTLQYLPAMDADRTKAMEKVRQEIAMLDHHVGSSSPTTKHTIYNAGHHTSSLKKRMTNLSSMGGSFTSRHSGRETPHKRMASGSSVGSFSEHDIISAVNALDQKWDAQVSRMQGYLYRNYCLAEGFGWQQEEAPPVSAELVEEPQQLESKDRPSTEESKRRLERGSGSSLREMLERVKLGGSRRGSLEAILDEKGGGRSRKGSGTTAGGGGKAMFELE
ncbi:uncharacterized protein AB675_9016 [Cyphellophora attinorum]|uniref:LRR-containing protein second PH domain-containing protein n=1 Tax=Cyphellophora attinorum TaxID=1664694 RepID=A0A0N1HBX6_9EURO|nr:uncharacterized protein AB675_9016 [Phialophora attinorum]KPI41653.1 hypothetical protein AB675_9016 [Phialophora attinorum]